MVGNQEDRGVTADAAALPPSGLSPASGSSAKLPAANAHTPGPWEVVEATEHHGWYVTSDFGNTICDLYCMSRPDLPSTLNGGISHPVPFMHEMDGPNARLIAAAPELLAVLERVNSELAHHGRVEVGTDLACRVSEVLTKATSV